MLNTLELKKELALNTESLKQALLQGNLQQIHNLKVQRDNLKDMLIEALEAKCVITAQLKKVS